MVSSLAWSSRAAFASVVLFVLVSCSAVGVTGNDGGAEGGVGGTITAKSASYTGAASGGVLTMGLTNDGTAAVAGLKEVRITVPSGELVFPSACVSCLVGTDSWCVGASASSTLKMNVSKLDVSGGAALGTTCKGASYAIGATTDSPSAATSDLPTSVTLKGTFTDGSPWAATAAVQ